MTVPDTVRLSAGEQRALTYLLQGVLALVLLYGLLTVQFGMAANGAFGLALTLVPAAIRREYHYTMRPALVLWITIAVALHSVGSLGPYEWLSWYDSVTHTVSATVAGGLGYAAFRGFERHSPELVVPARFRPVFIFVFVLAISVVWELVEFASGTIPQLVGLDAPLVVYGVEDIVTDMLFNALGAVVLAVGASGYFRSLGDFLSRRFDSRSS